MDEIQIIDYLKGTLHKEEKEKMHVWINESAENRAHFESIRAIWEAESTPLIKTDLDRSWRNLKSKQSQIQKDQYKRRWMLVAASMIPLLVSLIWLFSIKDSNRVEYLTGLNDVASLVELPDGSKVWLNRNSSISFLKEFEGEERKIRLSGEAFFDVARNEEKPFVIVSENTITTVLGTSFNVMAYPDSLRTQVDVAHGKVNVKSRDNQTNETVLTKGMTAQYNPISNKMVTIKQSSNRNRFAWRTRALIFENAGTNEIKNLVKKVYNVDLIFNQDQDCIQLNTSFSNEPLISILNTLKSLYNLNYRKISENKYEFEGTCSLNSK